MKKKGLQKLRVVIALAAVLALAVPLLGGGRKKEEKGMIVVGFIGSLDTDVGRSALRGAEIAIEELNEAGGILGGRQMKYVQADTHEDVAEGVKAYEYLAEVEKVDLIISGSIDDVSLGWLPRLAEYQIPTIETWTSAIRAIELVRDDYESYKSYFMPHMNDYLQGQEYLEFGKDILHDQMGWTTTVIFHEDTAYGGGVAEFVEQEIAPFAGIEVIGKVIYDIDTVDFSPLYAKIVDMDPDFIYHISSVNCVPPSAAYVELQVPIPITGVNVAAASIEFWDDMGGAAAGFSSISPPPSLGMDWDDRTQKFLDKYQAKYKTRPMFPHFDGFNAYYGVYMAVEAAERAGGFKPLDAWVKEMEETDLIIKKDGVIWQRYNFYKPGEKEPLVLNLEYPHSQKIDQSGEKGRPGGIVMQWYPDKTVKIIHPPKWANGEYYLPPWIPEHKRGKK